MTVTVDLDPEAYDVSAAYAGAKGISLSEAVSELVRRAEQAPEAMQSSSRLRENEYGYLEIAGTGHTITPEMAREASEDELIEWPTLSAGR